MRRPIPFIRFLSVALLAASSACASTQATTAGESAGEVAESRTVTLRVQNDNVSDVVIYLVGHGARQRVGLVNAASSATFELDVSRFPTGGAQFIADPVGGFGTGDSGSLTVSGGSEILFTIRPVISQSSAMVR